MLLIAEIILTIFAWRKGWKWLALLPVGICLLIGFFIGFTGGSLEGGMTIVPDLIATGILIWMVVKGPKSNETEEATKTN